MRRLPLGAALLIVPFAAALAQQPPGAQPAQPAQPGQATAPPAPAPPPANVWIAKPVAELVALDKVTARATPLTVRVGQTVAFASLSITVRACEVRPPDQPADATAYLDITDSHPGGPSFHGWMVVSAPSVSMLEHPIYDVRLAGCRE
jgi:hypothetical protein